MSHISVHITVHDANEKDADVRVTDFLRVGQHIPERINVIAAEAAAAAAWSLDIGQGTKIHRDRTRGAANA